MFSPQQLLLRESNTESGSTDRIGPQAGELWGADLINFEKSVHQPVQHAHNIENKRNGAILVTEDYISFYGQTKNCYLGFS